MDAGSSGTRALGYKYEDWTPASSGRMRPTPPKIDLLFDVKNKAGP